MLPQAAKTVAVAGLLVIGAVHAEEFQIALSGKGLDLEGVELVALDDSGSALWTYAVSEGGALRIAAPGASVVSCRSHAIWCPRVPLPPTAGEATPSTRDAGPSAVRSIALPAFRRSRFSLPLQLPPGDAIAEERFLVEGWLGAPPDTLQFVEPAIWDGRHLVWNGPTGRTTFRVTATGWAPTYLPAVEAVPGVNQLEPWSLVRGASLSVSLYELASGFPVAGARATAFLVAPPESDRVTATVREVARAVSDDYGFVQMAGLPPAVYTLRIDSEGRPRTRVDGIRLATDAETRLTDITLREFAEVLVYVAPAMSDRGPWEITLDSLNDQAPNRTAVGDAAGAATFRDVATGWYMLDVRAPDGGVLYSEQREITASGMLAVDLNLVTLLGRVRVDGEGAEADVELSRGAGDLLSFATDEQGRFSGRVPRPTKDVVQAVVETTDGLRRGFVKRPRIRNDVLRLSLDLGGQTLRGFVLDASTFEPLAGVPVYAESLATSAAFDDEQEYSFSPFTESQNDGSFAFDGLEEGSYVVGAEPDGFAEAEVIATAWPLKDNVPGDTRHIRLHLEPAEPLELLVTVGTLPLADARVSVTARGRSGATGDGFGRTDPAGRAMLAVPRGGAGPASVVVTAPGLLWSGCVSLPPSGDPILRLDLPQAITGTLALRTTSQRESDRTGETVIVTPDGGILTFAEVITDSLNQLVSGPVPDVLEVGGVPSGRYAIAEMPPSWSYVDACSGQLAIAGSWQVLAPGGRVEFEFDLGVEAGGTLAAFPPELFQ